MKKVFALVLISFMLVCTAKRAYATEQTADKKVQKLFEAALKQEKFDEAKEHLKNGADINKECYLCYSIINNKESEFNFLIENGANPDGTSKMWTPLYFAIHDSRNEMLDKLLEKGANPNKEAAVPLLFHTAVKKNNHAFEKLLYAGADPKKTFIKANTAQIIFANKNEEAIETLIKFQQKDFKKPATDINASIELLDTIQNGKPFYRAIKGENELKKPIKARYIDISTFGEYNTDVYFAVSYLKNKELTIFIDNKYAHEPKEVIALLIAGNSIHTDKKSSKTEYLYQLGAQALMYEEFLIKNPKLRLNKNSRPIQTYFNPVLTLIQRAKYNMNALWLMTFSEGFNKNMKETSPGFKNTDMNSYFEDL